MRYLKSFNESKCPDCNGSGETLQEINIFGDTSMCKCNSCNGSGNCELRDIKKLIVYIKSDIIEIFSKYKVRYSTIFDNINRYSENEDDRILCADIW